MYNLRKRQIVVVAVGTIIRHVNSEKEELDAKDRLEEDEVDVSMEKKDTKPRDVLLEEDNFGNMEIVPAPDLNMRRGHLATRQMQLNLIGKGGVKNII